MDDEQPGRHASAACLNCGEPLLGNYCFRCGQRRLQKDFLSLRIFFADAIAHVTSIDDTKIFRTLSALLTRPGLLTNEYIVGRRVDWLTPLKLYLSVFAVSFFLYSAFKSVALYDVSTLLAGDTHGVLKGMFATLAERRHLPQELFNSEVNAKWRTYVSLSQIAYPLLFAVVLKLAYVRQRRFFVEHVIFSMHYQALALLIVVLAWPLYYVTGVVPTLRTAWVAILITFVMIVYLVAGVRAVYRQSWPMSVVKGVVLYFAYYLIYSTITFVMLALAVAAVVRG